MSDKKLYKSNTDKKICGVCGGLGIPVLPIIEIPIEDFLGLPMSVLYQAVAVRNDVEGLPG